MLYHLRLTVDIFPIKYCEGFFSQFILVKHEKDVERLHYHIVGETTLKPATIRKWLNKDGFKGNRDFQLKEADELGYQYILKKDSTLISSLGFDQSDIADFRAQSTQYVLAKKAENSPKNAYPPLVLSVVERYKDEFIDVPLLIFYPDKTSEENDDYSTGIAVKFYTRISGLVYAAYIEGKKVFNLHYMRNLTYTIMSILSPELTLYFLRKKKDF